MNRRWPAAAAAAAAIAAHAGGCAVSRPYAPPRLYVELASGGAAGEAAATASPDAAEAAWSAAFTALDEDRAAGARLLEEEGPGGPVHPVDAAVLERLAPAASDPAAAAAALADGFALASVEALVLLRSPRVAAAREGVHAALEGYTQVGALDEVRRGFSAYTGASMADVGGAGMADAAAARYPLPGLLALKGRLVAAEVDGAREELDRARRDALAAARTVYWGLVETDEARRISAAIEALLARSEEAIRARYASGGGLLGDITRAQVRRERVRTDLATLARERELLAARLLALLALPQDAAVGVPGGAERVPEPETLERLQVRALERSQELRLLRAEARRMEILVAMAEREILPGESFGLALFENRPAAQAGTAAQARPFPVAVPAGEGAGAPRRPWFGRDAAFLAETRRRLAALRERIHAEEVESAARVHAAWFGLDRAVREGRLYGERIAELARLAAAAADSAYRSGRLALADSLGARIEQLDAELEAVRQRSAAGVAWAELERAAGGPADGGGP